MTATLARRAVLACALAGLATLAAAQPQTAAPAPAPAAGANPRVQFTTSLGAFTVELLADKAPRTVENFLQYVRDKHYDGTVFHRVIGNFMVQGGGYDTKYAEKPTRAPVRHEGREALARGGPRNTVGTLAMARTNDPQSATAQFFINVKDNAFLDPVVIPPGDPVPRFEYQGQVYENIPRARLEGASQLWGYTVFGKVVAGMDTIEKIRSQPTGPGGPFPTDVPRTPVVIQSAVVLK